MDLNKVMLIGNLGSDPEYHDMNTGKRMAKFSVATKRVWKKDGQKQEQVNWHNIVIFNPYLIENVVDRWLEKGTRVYLEGEVTTRSYEKDGEKKYITEIVIPQVRGELFVLARGKGWKDEPTEPGRPATSSTPAPSSDDFDDDIPF